MPSHLSSSTSVRVGALRFALLTVAAALLVSSGGLSAGASDQATRWDSISESSYCGAPYTRGPFAFGKGGLPDSQPILGPFGTYFGRSVGEVRSHLVYWTVPGANGLRVRVHEAMLPSLERVADKLEAHAAQGRVYRITSVGAFVPRTIGGSHQMSRHALGLAIDFNPSLNPYRGDGRLITNMPDWFIDVWRSEGFCWGGDWSSAKDPMHFSWMGPALTPVDDELDPHPPKTGLKSFGLAESRSTLFAGVTGQYRLSIGDGTGNGAPDVIGVRSHPDGTVIDITSSTRGYGECSVSRWFLDRDGLVDSEFVVFGDVDGDSGQDLIALNPTSGTMSAVISNRGSFFEEFEEVQTGVSTSAVAVAAGDFDGDHRADLWEVTADGRVVIWRGPGFAQQLADSALPGGLPTLIAVGDRDGGDTPELFVYRGGQVDVLRFQAGWSIETSFAVSTDVASISATDYDGDGRADVEVLGSGGVMKAYVGNTSTGYSPSSWFIDPDWDCDSDHPVAFEYHGTFFDDEVSIFETDIESIAAAGVTKGCNPPFNDRFCPKDVVTRETMAAFLVRALGLTQNTHPGFDDVPAGSTFANDIGKLATAGITRGCNPPENDEFCPDEPVTRETMAAFLVRALKLTEEGGHQGFRDVSSSSIFHRDILRLAAAGITKGCNPPANDRFCPKDEVTRETMAAFLRRAGLGS